MRPPIGAGCGGSGPAGWKLATRPQGGAAAPAARSGGAVTGSLAGRCIEISSGSSCKPASRSSSDSPPQLSAIFARERPTALAPWRAWTQLGLAGKHGYFVYFSTCRLLACEPAGPGAAGGSGVGADGTRRAHIHASTRAAWYRRGTSRLPARPRAVACILGFRPRARPLSDTALPVQSRLQPAAGGHTQLHPLAGPPLDACGRLPGGRPSA